MAEINSTNILTQLNAGSGINIRELATSLVNAEKAPREELITAKIERSEARVTGLGAIRFGLSELQNAFSALNQRSDFNGAAQAQSSQSDAFTATATAQAKAQTQDISVTQIALRQRSEVGTGFAATDSTLNGGNAMELSLIVGGNTETISVDSDSIGGVTPTGVVSAINLAGLGVSAELIDTGVEGDSRYRIVLSADETGADNAFSLSAQDQAAQTAIAELDDSELQSARDALLTVNGVGVTRSSNRIDDVITGVTLELKAPTTGTATLSLSRDTAAVKERFQELVTAYNEFDELLQVLGDRDSEIEDFGGAMAGDQLLSRIRAQVREMFTYASDDDRIVGGSGEDALQYGYQVGFTFDRDGRLSLDEDQLDEALNTRFDDVVTLFTNNTDIERQYGSEPIGLAAGAVRTLGTMLRNNEDQLLFRQETTAQNEITRYQEDLTQLEERMDRLLSRYIEQFAAMESIVGQTNSLRDSLASSFEGLMAVYTNK